MKHTKEPWTTDEDYIESDSINYWIAKCNWIDYEIAEANAKRIVACVNACAGITTEALEADVIYITLKDETLAYKHTPEGEHIFKTVPIWEDNQS